MALEPNFNLSINKRRMKKKYSFSRDVGNFS
jgi:hypothetical protein